MLALLGQFKHATSGDEKDAFAEMEAYVNDNFTECVFALGTDYPATWDQNTDSVYYTGEWFPNHNWTHPDLSDGLEFTWVTWITGVYAPESPATCTSLEYNNSAPLGHSDPLPLTTVVDVDLDEGDGSLLGPIYGGARITASSDFESFNTSCVSPMCSYASFSEENSGEWSIDQMVLYVDGTLTVSNGTLSEDIENARIELMGSALGTWKGNPVDYEVNAGDAVFLVAGEADDEHVTLVVSNSTDITASESAGEWTLDSFEIEYVDDSSNTWTVHVAETTWLE